MTRRLIVRPRAERETSSLLIEPQERRTLNHKLLTRTSEPGPLNPELLTLNTFQCLPSRELIVTGPLIVESRITGAPPPN